MLNFSKYITCENVINSILIVIIIILLINIIQKQLMNNEPLTDVDDDTKDKFKKAKLVVYKTNSCGYCQKFMKLLTDLGLNNDVRLVDVETEKGKAEYTTLGQRGVPVIKCDTTGEIYVGYTDNIEELLHKLKM